MVDASIEMQPAYELFIVDGPGHRRRPFGLAPTLDDVPSEVLDTEGVTWVQAYLDFLDHFAIYTKKVQA